MGGACTSIKDKKIKSNQKEEEKKGDENGDKEKDKKESENTDKDKGKNDSKNKENGKGINEREITFKIINKEQEFIEKVKSSEKISYLFTLIAKYKTKKFSEYDLIFEEDISLASKINDDIGEVFQNEENVTLKMFYLGLDISFDIKKDYETSNSLIAQPLYDLGGKIGLLIYHKFENTFTSEIVNNDKLSKYNHLSSFCNCKNVLYNMWRGK